MELQATFIRPDPRIFIRDHNKWLRAANVRAAKYHQRVHVPRHFQNFAAAKYGYLPRSQKYLKYKERRYGSTRPFVKTGATEDALVGMRQHEISATPKGAKLTLRLPFKGGTGRFLDAKALKRLKKVHTESQVRAQKAAMARVAEMEAISPDEQRTLNEQIEQQYGADVKYAFETGNVKTRIRGG